MLLGYNISQNGMYFVCRWFFGGSGRVSEVLNHKRCLSLQMVKQLHDGLNIRKRGFLLTHKAIVFIETRRW